MTRPGWWPDFDDQQRNLLSMGLAIPVLIGLKLLFPVALHLSPFTFIGWYLTVLGVAALAIWSGTTGLLAHDGAWSRLILTQWLLLLLVLSAQVINATDLFQQHLRPFQERRQAGP